MKLVLHIQGVGIVRSFLTPIPSVMSLVFVVLLGYLVGSIPIAFFLVRSKGVKDITKAGTGNVGAYNSYSVTGSKWTGVSVMLLDGVKGAVAVFVGMWLASELGEESRVVPWLALIGAVAGHNYNLWLSMRKGSLAGGKGLATVAGGLFVIHPISVGIWFVFFGIGLYLFSIWSGIKDTIPGNVAGTIAAPAAGFAFFTPFLGSMLSVLALLILPKHINQMQELIKRGINYRKSNNSKTTLE